VELGGKKVDLYYLGKNRWIIPCVALFRTKVLFSGFYPVAERYHFEILRCLHDEWINLWQRPRRWTLISWLRGTADLEKGRCSGDAQLHKNYAPKCSILRQENQLGDQQLVKMENTTGRFNNIYAEYRNSPSYSNASGN
jgi:hypothetical protein